MKEKPNEDFLLAIEQNIESDDLKRKIRSLYLYIRDKKSFLEKPAAKRHHHAYHGGLAKHTYDVILWAVSLNDDLKFPYKQDDVFLAAFLHDLGKLYVYRFDENREIQIIKTPISEEALAFRLAYKFDIKPNINVISAVEFAHGGWSSLAKNKYIQPRTLHAIIHAADMFSTHFEGEESDE